MNILPKDGEVKLFTNFFSIAESDYYFQHFLHHTNWTQEPIFIFGKKIMQPRLTAWYGDQDKKFGYSGIVMQNNPWTSELKAIKEKIEAVAQAKFTGALLNQYRSGADSMGWHRDNEAELGKNPIIASVSFGATRVFQFRHYENKKLKTSVELTHGSLLLMQKETQHYWEHAINKTAKPTGTRINLTFRTLLY
jgi:alkylated DNA repair dioxygenase AlkB